MGQAKVANHLKEQLGAKKLEAMKVSTPHSGAKIHD